MFNSAQGRVDMTRVAARDVPLAALQQRRGPADLTPRGVQARRAIGDHQQAGLDLQPALDEFARKRRADLAILRRRLHEAEEDLSPVIVTPTAVTISSSAKVLPSRSSATRS